MTSRRLFGNIFRRRKKSAATEYTERYRSGDVCERRRGRMKRAKRSGRGRKKRAAKDAKFVSGTATGHNGAPRRKVNIEVILFTEIIIYGEVSKRS